MSASGEIAGLDRLEHGGGRFGRLDLVALALEQQAQRLEHIGLVVGDEDAVRGGIIGCHWGK